MPPRIQAIGNLCEKHVSGSLNTSFRTLNTTAARAQSVTTDHTSSPSSPPPSELTTLLDPATVSTRRQERQVQRHQHINPVGSRRRRAALQSSPGIPFTQLPYQCFQEARKILQADREEKLKQIQIQREKIDRVAATNVSSSDQTAVTYRDRRLKSLREHLDKLKIFADINDPIVKKNFEDGQGDLNKPIYRYLADRKWREYKRKVVMQRIEQMHVVPDVVPTLDPIVNVDVAFGRRQYLPGDFVPSIVSEQAPRLNTQSFHAGTKLVTIAIVDSDVPDLELDRFGYRCHYLAANVPLSATTRAINLGNLEQGEVLLAWKAPYAQKGSPYHRLSVFVMEQAGAVSEAQYQKNLLQSTDDKKFNLRSLIDTMSLKPIGVSLFRTQWDEHMDGVMQRLGVEGVGEELKRKRVEPLPYKWTPKMGKKYR